MNNPAYNLLAPLPIIGDKVTDLSAYLSGMFKIGIGLAIAFAILMIVWGGLEYMLSGIPGVKGDGLKKMNDAILGLLLVLGAWLLLHTINPNLVDFKKIDVDSLNLATSTPWQAYGTGNLDLNKQQVDIYKTAAEKEKKVADLRLNAVAISAEDPVQAGILEAQANELEKTAAKQKAEDAGATDLQIALRTLKSFQTVGFDDETLNSINLNSNSVKKIYDEGITTLIKDGDVAGAMRLKDKEQYSLSTINSESLVSKTIAIVNAPSQILTSVTLNSKIQTTIDAIKAQDAIVLTLIQDSTVRAQFNTESIDRISRLQALPAIIQKQQAQQAQDKQTTKIYNSTN